jgi:NAD(P)-dependent dehydrogenase (short-subunit alcohol dehydrogenase family)
LAARSASGCTPGGITVAAGYSRGKEAADKFCADHPGATVHQGNIGSAEDCERVIREVLEAHGKLDILVNNAGITLDKTVRKMTVEDWDRVVPRPGRHRQPPRVGEL